ncbi:MAG: isochorismatase [candidate division Zixibacteria bacterium]|nr:isochorismatase [candidate division Zixibacteria bacterium]NIR67128.1 isochorismatase [candidate division Zixibacteria bacterium]NIS15365.1 isochorismatase [candidate division Zixibacteria bacterium]NIS48554.1 isochorismatase [candidate division Zixibacteria bacterium]NIT52315.1 isochorismatase [candidate division Zixibacteria bacterium]
MTYKELPIPHNYNEEKVSEVWRIDYRELSKRARAWAKEHKLRAAPEDKKTICLLLVDCQNTFCTPGYELFVAGRSGNGAVEDSKRICKFIYRNLGIISNMIVSMDTHKIMHVFHPFFLVDSDGNHPAPMTIVSLEDVESGKWMVNPDVAKNIPGKDYDSLQRFLNHYCKELEKNEKLQLMIWPYHSMLGGIGHALVSAIEEALFFYGIARKRQPEIEIKGENQLTENYSIFRPEVTEDEKKQPIASENKPFFDNLLSHDRIVVAGQAKSHCVAWTVEDLLAEIKSRDPDLARKIYLMEDCSSPVVIPDVVDFTEKADEAFQKFSDEGMNLVKSTEPVASWPGMDFLK